MLLTQHRLPWVFCPHPPFPLCFLFGFVFLGGLEAVNPGQVHSPLAAFIVSFYALHCNLYCIWMDSDNFVMKWIKKGNPCQFALPNPNPKSACMPSKPS